MTYELVNVKDFKEITGIHITVNHTAKMEGFWSLSTSCLVNPFCIKMQESDDPTVICTKCYAGAMAKRYGNLNKALEQNADILTSELLEVFPRITVLNFRFEAFGDLINVTQAINYLNIAYANPRVGFGIWTKRPDILAKAIEQVGKPDNLEIQLSSVHVNKVADASKWDFVDRVFTVYDADYAVDNGVVINCGGANCSASAKCYTDNQIKEISEMLKSQLKKYEKTIGGEM